jgi:hypothetical protein
MSKKGYLDMTVREILDFMDDANAGQFAFDGPGPKGEEREHFCCVFAIGETASRIFPKKAHDEARNP